MGIKAAETMINIGISREAFQTYADSFSEVIKDLPYAHTVRRFVIWGAYYGFLTPIIQIATDHPACKKALFDSVSGKKAYRDILMGTISITLFIRITITLIRWLVKRIVTFHGKHFPV